MDDTQPYPQLVERLVAEVVLLDGVILCKAKWAPVAGSHVAGPSSLDLLLLRPFPVRVLVFLLFTTQETSSEVGPVVGHGFVRHSVDVLGGVVVVDANAGDVHVVAVDAVELPAVQ